MRKFRSKAVACAALAAFAFLVSPAASLAQAQAPAAGTGSLVGFIYGKDMKTPVSSAVVKIRNIENGKEFSSPPTDKEGMYTIPAIDAGKYILGVTAENEDYNFDYALALKEGELAKLSVALKPGAPAAAQDTAEEGKSKFVKFFTSPAGIVTLVVVAGGVIYLLTMEKEASPIIR